MCFSMESDVAIGLVLVPVGVLALREVRQAREIPFAALPLLFAAHQLTEALVWAGMDGRVSPATQEAATMAYLVVALAVLPILMPLAVLLLEPHGSRQRVAWFVGLGAVVSAYFGFVLLTEPVSAVEHDHALAYDTGVSNGWAWTGLYIVATVGPALMSGYRSIVAFGVVNLVGLTVVALFYAQGFISLWCVQAALGSALVLVHMLRRRRLPDHDRIDGHRVPVSAAAT